MTKHKEDDCQIPFCDKCLARIKRVKAKADSMTNQTAQPQDAQAEEQLKKRLYDMEAAYGTELLSADVLKRPIIAMLHAKELLHLITQEQRNLLDRLEKNGHGGGNWRRLIEIERSRL